MNVILVAAKKDFVNDYFALFKECGLNPVVMDVDCFAVANVYEANYGAGDDGAIALIDLGASSRITSYNVCYTKLLRTRAGHSWGKRLREFRFSQIQPE